MGKNVATERTKPKRKNAKRLNISSGYTKSLAVFVKKLESESTDQSSKTILPKVHSIIKQNKRKICFDYRKLKEKLRICKKCDKWNKINSIIQCLVCEDNYHKQCIIIKDELSFVCLECKDGKKMNRCGKCKKKVIESCIKQCMKCKLIFHDQCWKGGPQKCRKCVNLEQKAKKAKAFDPIVFYTKQIANQDTICTAYSGLFQYERLVSSEKELSKYTNSLMEAIKAKDMLYFQQLVNMEEFADILNENSMDFGINLMKKPEEEAYKLYKKFPIGPYIFRKIQGKGYDVVADKNIPQKTLICEYVGEVVTLRECIKLQSSRNNDSLMQLQAGKNSNETLIIRPERFTNMARFINGVRKNSDEGNIETMKLLYKGKPLVLLVAKREIKKGESLCYDYNAGGIAAEYDTSHFL